MASSAFSFHCMICFEEFDPQTNYPVVLPCGHTYVCVECANRLDKCMECRTPLTMKLELPPPPPPPSSSSNTNTPNLGVNAATTTTTNTAAAAGSSSGSTSPSIMRMIMMSSGNSSSSIINPTPPPSASALEQQKENQKNQYAERVKNSPGWRRRYGVESTGVGNNNTNHPSQYYGKRNTSHHHHHPSHSQQPHPPQPVPKVRLPLPKNAVLLSLIQASEPARRRAEVEAPSTPQKAQDENLMSPPRLSSSGGGGGGGGGGNTNSTNYSGLSLVGSGSGGSSGGGSGGISSLPQFSRPSPLFLDKSHSSDHHDPILGGSGGGGFAIDNSADDEEHKIRVGTYLEGGPCGTYAVAVKSGLLVYPTLFEHTLPSALSGLRGRGGSSGGGVGGGIAGGSLEEEEIDVMKRDVEQVVKNYYREGVMKNEKKVEEEAAAAAAKKKKGEKMKLKKNSNRSSSNAPGSSDSSNNNLATWVECHEDEKVETHCRTELLDDTMTSQQEIIAEDDEEEEAEEEDEDETDEDEEEAEGGEASDHFTSMSDPGVGGTIAGQSVTDIKSAAIKSIYRGSRTEKAAGSESEAAGNSEATAELSFSLTISEDENDTGNNTNNNDDECSSTECDVGVNTSTIRRSQSTASASASQSTTPTRSNDSTALGGKKYVRHFSVGAYPAQTVSQKENIATGANDNNDDFERPLIRLKYGDRVQVVSMDSRGWVKLARGYGYIRLENDKQLVKVGGTSDRACQIEAMLHELSLERNRLKHEQMKLERLSAGLMIDLQSSLLTSDDHVVVPAPQGMKRSDSDLSYSVRSKSPPGSSHDDIDVSTRSRPSLSPSQLRGEQGQKQSSSHHREIRTAKSHSPGRSSSLGAQNKLPPSPPFGQVLPSLTSHHNWSTGVNTPTRVNFRTGLSGHRALTSTHSHPHDFIGGGAVRSMSNHAGISSSKKSDRRGRSIY